MNYSRIAILLMKGTSNCIKQYKTLSYARQLTYYRRLHDVRQPLEGATLPSSVEFLPLDDSSSTDPINDELSDVEDDGSMDPLSLREVPSDDVIRKFPASCNLAAFVNQSETLQQFLKLGVHLSHWDGIPDIPVFIMKLDFERDVKERLRFLHDIGVTSDKLGLLLTKNPNLLREDIDDMEVRINYLRSKKFDEQSIARIVSKAPFFLTQAVKVTDVRLGYFQREFRLSGEEVRLVAVGRPTLLTCSLGKLKENQFILKEEFGFELAELKQLLKTQAKVWSIERTFLYERFDYIHNTMGISHEMIVHFPGCLLTRIFILKQRHQFLVAIKRDQYDPTKENYVSLKSIVSGNDAAFCSDVAKISVGKFNDFLKTL